jgi:DNA-binding transcriptional LysR family regulator
MQRRHDTLNIPIELLRSFVAIQESGSFTKAADLLNLTQPAISAQVKRLQQLVGGEVFTRTGFGVSLTEKGEVVSRYARRILAMNDQILYLAGTNSSVPTFRVGIPSVFAASMLSRSIAACQGIAEAGRVQFACDQSLELERSLMGGYLDIILVGFLAPLSQRLIARWSEPLVWVCARDLALRPGAPIPFLSWPNGVSDRAAIGAIEAVGLQYSVVFVSSDFSAHLAALRSGLGFVCLPERVVPSDLKIAREPFLPALPAHDAGVYIRDGIDSKKAIQIAQVLAEAVQPAALARKGEAEADQSRQHLQQHHV